MLAKNYEVIAIAIPLWNEQKLTLFDIMMVIRALLDALMATFSVVAWKSTSTACRKTYVAPRIKCGIMPMVSLLRSLGSVAVQNKASIVSRPNAENKRSPT